MHLQSLPMITIFIFLIIPLGVAPLSFNFNSFSADDDSIRYERAYAANNKIQLTTNVADLARATFAKHMHLWDKASGNLTDFTTHFSFVIDSQNRTTYADGFTFFLAPVSSRIPDGATKGGTLGLTTDYDAPNSKDNAFVAVEFDIFNNSWDPCHDHVGIDINSLESCKAIAWWSSIPDGKQNEAWINYDSTSKNLSVVFTGFRSHNTTVQQGFYYMVDLRHHLPEWVTFGFSASTGAVLSSRQSILSWDFNSTDLPVEKSAKRKSRLWVTLGHSLGGIVLVVLLLFAFWKWSSNNRNELEISPKKLPYKKLARATNNFAHGNKLGEGGFGGVYKGYLDELNVNIAVKKKSRDSEQGEKEFTSEVRTISRLRHRNLVKLIGWCHNRGGLFPWCRKEKVHLLVYEFMHNGSLYSHLFNESSLLTWAARYKIVQGLASALLYLHEEWEPNRYVLHRDIKSQNVMLDSNFDAKLGDFGLARIVDCGKQIQTSVVAGTVGYMAPESLTGTASKESDVYSFGIMALEIASGRRPNETHVHVSQKNTVSWVRELYRMGNHMEAADPRLGSNFDEQQMKRLLIVGLWCTNPNFSLRPSIREVVLELNSNDTLLPELPIQMPMPTHVSSTCSSV